MPTAHASPAATARGRAAGLPAAAPRSRSEGFSRRRAGAGVAARLVAMSCEAATPATPLTRPSSATAASQALRSRSPKTTTPQTKAVHIPMPHQTPGPTAAPSAWIAGHASSWVPVRIAAPAAPHQSHRTGTCSSSSSRRLSPVLPTVTQSWKSSVPAATAAGCLAGSELPPKTSAAPAAATHPWRVGFAFEA